MTAQGSEAASSRKNSKGKYTAATWDLMQTQGPRLHCSG
jgi:hypothetical protein